MMEASIIGIFIAWIRGMLLINGSMRRLAGEKKRDCSSPCSGFPHRGIFRWRGDMGIICIMCWKRGLKMALGVWRHLKMSNRYI